ncbi:hypothetical protein QBC38DRAFT_462313 [Podospora fimiseda]|uniref:Ecp2 effector protein domain-containing protein n=1 Tax=Podospora fimiseda TaxID=252190 RepID=A0AAN7BGB6_9PEZI|nr:hypothetical protein QBC38DRAFT_462313 [Podospora fimiseda]
MFHILSLLALIGTLLTVSAWDIRGPYCSPSIETYSLITNATAKDCRGLVDWLQTNASNGTAGAADFAFYAGTPWLGEYMTHWYSCRYIANTLPTPNINSRTFVGGYGVHYCDQTVNITTWAEGKMGPGPVWWAIIGKYDPIPDFVREQVVSTGAMCFRP